MRLPTADGTRVVTVCQVKTRFCGKSLKGRDIAYAQSPRPRAKKQWRRQSLRPTNSAVFFAGISISVVTLALTSGLACVWDALRKAAGKMTTQTRHELRSITDSVLELAAERGRRYVEQVGERRVGAGEKELTGLAKFREAFPEGASDPRSVVAM